MSRYLGHALTILVASSCAVGTAWAQLPAVAVAPAAATPAAHTSNAPKPDAARAQVLRTAQERLATGDDPAVRAALATLSELGSDAAADSVSARLHRGLPPQLIEPAIDALVLLNRPSAAPALLELTQYRRAPIRASAVAALGALHARTAQSALLYALDDPSSEVRAAAALALMTVGNARALPALWAAADRGVEHALQTIGSLATPADLKSILARAREADITPIKPVLQGMMGRKSFATSGKLAVIHALEKLGSASARACLVEWLDAWKTEGDPALRKALFDAIKRLDAGHAPIKLESVPTKGGKP
ncbi:MAG TPA: HEAT repeat domain-containing protein [Polyangiales bacterium]